jgi:Family of unknown function (DUF5677)
MSSHDGTFPSVDRVPVDLDSIQSFTREEEFTALAFDLLREVTSYVTIAACVMGQEPRWNRDQAAIGGNMVRLWKILCAFLDQKMQRRYETTTIFARLAFETIVSVRYLAENFDPDLVDSFVRFSFRHERRLADKINQSISERGGEILHIEQRMLNSINRSAQFAGIELESVDLKDRAPWGGKNLKDKAKAVGLEIAYDAAFGGMSHNVHGAWQDLYQFHLESEDGEHFTPKLSWGNPRPQITLALGQLSIGAVHSSVAFLGGQHVLEELEDQLGDLYDRVHSVNVAHEAYISKKTWPEI